MLDQLNPQQREAVVQTEGPLLILAGAGSGKTRVLTFRIAHLLREKNISPHNILAVTFTNKAAGEMRERIEKILGEGAMRNMWVSTFHSICLRILRRHASLLGYKPDFSIYDDSDQDKLISQCLEELGYNPKILTPKMAASIINRSKNNGWSVEEYAANNDDFFGEKLAKVYDAYQKKLLTNQAMDFGDLILNVLKLFQNHPDVLHYYQNTLKYIHVDEYQDTNICQYQLIRLLSDAHRNICVVGDDDQSIYKFRGAEIRNILDFQKDFSDSTVVKLEQNYRSTQNILKAASGVVANNRRRMGKTLWTDNGDGELIGLFKAPTEKDEARFVGQEIEKHKPQYSYQEMAVFYRTNAQSRPIEDELRKRKIPYMIIGGMKFYDRMEIKDMLAYLKVLVNPADSMALKRIINVPARAIGKTTIDKLESIAQQAGTSLWDTILEVIKNGSLQINKGTLDKLTQFATLLARLNSLRQSVSLTDFMTTLFEETGYWKMLTDEKTLESESRLENLEELVTVVSEYVAEHEDATLEGFLDQAMLVSAVDVQGESNEYVTLMTLHLAKGLEFPLVFMVGMEEGLFPHNRSLNSDDDLEEERRLCYVGMTRAMKKLNLSFATQRSLFGSSQFNLPSRFLQEIPSELLIKQGYDVSRLSNVDDREFRSFGRDDDFNQSSSADDFNQDNQNPFQRGARVRHAVFGVGTIRATEGEDENQKLTIAFQNGGIKKLLTKYANLELVNGG
ncbi:DNA helicase PcrA [bacterium]|nr:DNA helicase PcrA [bacterium]